MSITYDFAMKDVARRWWRQGPVLDTPVDHIRKQLPRGNGDWPGFDAVYDRLQSAAHKMASEKYMHCSDEHVTLMAIMGCGHEETMKAEMHRLSGRGYVVFTPNATGERPKTRSEDA
jgi:hypothetical protein